MVSLILICSFGIELKKMFQRIIVLFIVILSNSAFSQEKVEWTYTYDDVANEIHLKAEMADGWHLYSQHIDDGIGPVPTSFTFDQNDAYKTVGKTTEPNPIVKYDPNFEGELAFFSEEALFIQKIKVKKSGDVKGTIVFMACNDEMCLPPEDKLFTISIEK
ncbi:MAG: hypothetical protein ACI837_003058 [Crocinitomicaceae bacterium]